MLDLYNWLLEISKGIGGYTGIFVVSILGNLIPFMPIPYLAVVFFYAAYVPGVDPYVIGLISGIGGGIGKLIVYLFSRGASKLLPDEKEEQLKIFSKLIGDYGALAVFIFAATPSPDDVIITVLGIAKYNVLKFFIAVTLGKIIISILTAIFGKMFNFLLGEEGSWYSFIYSLVFFFIITWIILSIDWMSVLEITNKEGWKGLAIKLRDVKERKKIFKPLFLKKSNKEKG